MNEIETRFYSSLNSNIRLHRDLNVYSKLVCAELIALADDVSVYETDEQIAELLHLPTIIVRDALDLLEAYEYISREYTPEERIITLARVAL